MAGLYINDYRPWPRWVVSGNEEMAHKFGAQIGTYRGHADRDPGHDMTGDLAADFFLFDNSKARHDAFLSWFMKNARRLGATYIITRSRIWSVARAAEGVRRYSGPDPHTDHIHVSYGTEAPSGGTPPPPQEDELPTPKDVWQDDGTVNNEGFAPGSEGRYVSGSDALKGILTRVMQVKADVGTLENHSNAEFVAVNNQLKALDTQLKAILAKLP